MKLSLAKLSAASLATALVVAAGGTSISSARSASASSAGPIKILAIADYTGLGQNLHYLYSAVEAAAANVRIEGRKVDLIYCDTKANPAAASACVENAKAQGIVAAMPFATQLDNITNPILAKQGIPIIASSPSTPQAQYLKTSACFLNGPYILFPNMALQMAKAGAKSLSMMLPAGIPITTELQDSSNAAAQSAGGAVKQMVPINQATATDYSSIAASTTNGGEDGVYLDAVPPGLFSLITDLVQQTPGVRLAAPGYLVGGDEILGALDKIPAAKGMLINNYTAFPTDTANPGVALFRKEIAKYGKQYQDNNQAIAAWAEGVGAMRILESIKSGPIDAASILNAMKTTTVTFDGVIPPWHYQYNTLGLGCVTNNYAYVGIYTGGTKITPLNDDKAVLGMTNSAIAVYKKAFAKFAQ